MEVNLCASHNPELISPETSIGEAAGRMSECDIGALFIRNDDKLVGVVTDRDIITRGLAKGVSPQTPVKDIMTQKVLYCFSDDSVEAVAENFAQNKVRRLPVLDRNKRLVGIVSLGDLSRKGQTDALVKAYAGISQPNKT